MSQLSVAFAVLPATAKLPAFGPEKVAGWGQVEWEPGWKCFP